MFMIKKKSEKYQTSQEIESWLEENGYFEAVYVQSGNCQFTADQWEDFVSLKSKE